MKFQTLDAFEKHIEGAFPDHLSSAYIVICPKAGERKAVLTRLTAKLEEISDFFSTADLKEALLHLQTGSLFSGKRSALLDGAESLLKGELETLATFLQHPPPSSHLLLGASSGKTLTPLYKGAKNTLIFVDLSGEKPWDERRRIERFVVQEVTSRGRQIAPDAVHHLLEQLPLDRPLLEQEIEKLLLYVGEKKTIDRGDVAAICSVTIEENPFEWAKRLIWEGASGMPTCFDLSFLLPLIAQMRVQLEMGLKMSGLIQKGEGHEKIAAAFPKVWPKTLDRCLEKTRRKGGQFFRKGLRALYQFELGIKTNRGRADLLLAQFCLALQLPS